MRKMQALQPEVKAIQDRYAKYKLTDPERQKMNQEMMALYKQKGVNPGERLFADAADDADPVRVLRHALGRDRAAGRAVLRLDPRPVGERPAVHHAGRDGRDDVLAAVADAVHGGSDAEADLHAHADHLHVHLPRLPRRSRDLLAGQQPDGDRPATRHQSPPRTAAAGRARPSQGRGPGAAAKPARKGQS